MIEAHSVSTNPLLPVWPQVVIVASFTLAGVSVVIGARLRRRRKAGSEEEQ